MVAVEANSGRTFAEAMAACVDANTYAAPNLGKKRLAEMETADVLAAVQPIWVTRSETAGRLRGRIEASLSWITAQGFRSGRDPARGKS